MNLALLLLFGLCYKTQFSYITGDISSNSNVVSMSQIKTFLNQLPNLRMKTTKQPKKFVWIEIKWIFISGQTSRPTNKNILYQFRCSLFPLR